MKISAISGLVQLVLTLDSCPPILLPLSVLKVSFNLSEYSLLCLVIVTFTSGLVEKDLVDCKAVPRTGLLLRNKEVEDLIDRALKSLRLFMVREDEGREW